MLYKVNIFTPLTTEDRGEKWALHAIWEKFHEEVTDTSDRLIIIMNIETFD